MDTRRLQNGYVALVSVVLISAVLLVMVIMVSGAGFYTRFTALDFESKKVSTALAESCMEMALVRLSGNKQYTPASSAGDLVIVDSSVTPSRTCRICSVSGSGPYTIVTRAVFPQTTNTNKAYTTLAVQTSVGVSNVVINSWVEQGSYTGSCSVP